MTKKKNLLKWFKKNKVVVIGLVILLLAMLTSKYSPMEEASIGATGSTVAEINEKSAPAEEAESQEVDEEFAEPPVEESEKEE